MKKAELDARLQVRANYPVPLSEPMFYFETLVLNGGQDEYVKLPVNVGCINPIMIA